VAFSLGKLIQPVKEPMVLACRYRIGSRWSLASAGGKPCIRGQRIRVTDVLDLLSHGASHEEMDYPTLEREDILAAIAYASRLTGHVVLRAA
jgi:uncharacterized protein (DUF433 family)